ncbi:MAG: C40 family peptidase [Hydrotalea flava]|uniref:C40 family peptidase n=1 Tax=Hydrotalea TaxID=1004300 RepID=UPI0009441EEF|nr:MULTISPECIES: C40 family peptidase [Hydrotalea]MBY0348012.1 C40 family peptidase [Hydrotalea flava]RWZ89537.1 MAG: hydrolase Nlp/P60 [Hydrotalea sp. AMD]
MSFAVCIVAVAPVRIEPTHKSEMVTELLFLESVTVLERLQDFIKVKCHYDGYEGWCQQIQLVETAFLPETYGWHHQPINEVIINNQLTRVSMGTTWNDTSISLPPFDISFKEAKPPAHFDFTEQNIQRITRAFLGTPYLWGGKSVFGIDCSGFTQQVFKLFNIVLPRDAYQQAALGKSIGFLEEANCGDLAFFDNEEGHITHVGILFNTHTIIHASGYVKIDAIDAMGIISTLHSKRTHRLRLIKTFRE